MLASSELTPAATPPKIERISATKSHMEAILLSISGYKDHAGGPASKFPQKVSSERYLAIMLEVGESTEGLCKGEKVISSDLLNVLVSWFLSFQAEWLTSQLGASLKTSREKFVLNFTRLTVPIATLCIESVRQISLSVPKHFAASPRSSLRVFAITSLSNSSIVRDILRRWKLLRLWNRI